MKSLFCDKCRSIMKIENIDGKIIGKCSCGFEKEVILNIGEKGEKDMRAKGVFKEEESKEGVPHVCQKCGHTESDVQDLGAPYSDESNVYLFRCKKCKNVERQADGSGNG